MAVGKAVRGVTASRERRSDSVSYIVDGMHCNRSAKVQNDALCVRRRVLCADSRLLRLSSAGRGEIKQRRNRSSVESVLTPGVSVISSYYQRTHAGSFVLFTPSLPRHVLVVAHVTHPGEQRGVQLRDRLRGDL
eukprot:scaffold50215_cov48-Phaeocystis_antarctica.AAC.1